MSLNRRVACLLVLGLVALPGAAVGAVRPEVLPSLQLRSLHGEAVPEAAYVRPGRWLLVYLSPRGSASRGLLREVEAARASTDVLVVVEGPADEAKALAAGSRLKATWVADPDLSFLQQVKLQTVPLVVGLTGRKIEWTLAGVSPDRTTFHSLVASWR